VLKDRRDRLPVQWAHERSKRGFHSASLLAQELNLSVRTLYRQLHQKGTSLQTLKDESRHDEAADLPRRTERPIIQTAQAVGLRNEESFARVFRSWTGFAATACRLGKNSRAPVSARPDQRKRREV
jgi:AraC-like DNA-binding protein